MSKSELELFAESELKRAGFFDKDGMLGDAVIELIRVFHKQEHSGFSAPSCASLFYKLARRKLISPLTGEDSEWNKIDGGIGGPEFQNNRCSHVFKRCDGVAYDIRAVIFEQPDGVRYTSSDSVRDITFPYTADSVIARVSMPERTPRDEVLGDRWTNS